MTDYAGVKAWRKANPEKVAEQSRRRRKRPQVKQLLAANSKRWRERHIDELRPIEAEKARTRRKNDPEGQRRRTAKFKARREVELAALVGRSRPAVCDVCNEFHLRIVFDHCHSRGHFRGWLCDRCNKTLGIIKDSPELLRALALYLEKDHGATNGICAEANPQQRIWDTIAAQISFGG
jgi:hypothetical protein